MNFKMINHMNSPYVLHYRVVFAFLFSCGVSETVQKEGVFSKQYTKAEWLLEFWGVANHQVLIVKSIMLIFIAVVLLLYVHQL